MLVALENTDPKLAAFPNIVPPVGAPNIEPPAVAVDCAGLLNGDPDEGPNGDEAELPKGEVVGEPNADVVVPALNGFWVVVAGAVIEGDEDAGAAKVKGETVEGIEVAAGVGVKAGIFVSPVAENGFEVDGNVRFENDGTDLVGSVSFKAGFRVLGSDLGSSGSDLANSDLTPGLSGSGSFAASGLVGSGLADSDLTSTLLGSGLVGGADLAEGGVRAGNVRLFVGATNGDIEKVEVSMAIGGGAAKVAGLAGGEKLNAATVVLGGLTGTVGVLSESTGGLADGRGTDLESETLGADVGKVLEVPVLPIENPVEGNTNGAVAGAEGGALELGGTLAAGLLVFVADGNAKGAGVLVLVAGWLAVLPKVSPVPLPDEGKTKGAELEGVAALEFVGEAKVKGVELVDPKLKLVPEGELNGEGPPILKLNADAEETTEGGATLPFPVTVGGLGGVVAKLTAELTKWCFLGEGFSKFPLESSTSSSSPSSPPLSSSIRENILGKFSYRSLIKYTFVIFVFFFLFFLFFLFLLFFFFHFLFLIFVSLVV